MYEKEMYNMLWDITNRLIYILVRITNSIYALNCYIETWSYKRQRDQQPNSPTRRSVVRTRGYFKTYLQDSSNHIERVWDHAFFCRRHALSLNMSIKYEWDVH